MSQLETGARRIKAGAYYQRGYWCQILALVTISFVNINILHVEAGWTETAKLVADDTLPESWAGWGGKGVDISGGTVIVGAAQPNLIATGEVYVYQGSGANWTQITELTASDGSIGDKFGKAVAISDNLAVVTAINENSSRGAAYVFEYANSVWQQVAKLVADDRAASDTFGSDVAIHGNKIIVGANHDRDQGHFTGAAYVFENDGSGWEQSAKLIASDQAIYDGFGSSVSIFGNTAVVGAVDEGSDGSVYVFEDTGSGWQEVEKLTASDGSGGNGGFGFSLDMQEDRFVVGRFRGSDGGLQTGAAYVFDKTLSGWDETTKLVPSDGAAGDQFGISVGLDGDTIVVGSYLNDEINLSAGAAYVFENDGASWQEINKLTSSTGQALDRFGYSVAIDAGTIISAAQGDDQAGSSAGAAYVFTTVPEPSSLLLGALGALGLMMRRRRKTTTT